VTGEDRLKYRLTVKDGFAAAHRIVGSGTRCEELHGHNFKVELTVGGDQLGEGGMLVDFGVLKGILRDILEDLDHSDLNNNPVFDEGSPSSENIARYISERCERELASEDVTVLSVMVQESDRAQAVYAP
jgi:6-pyruvoyltetrahydropterin/6-carboxytetrahydropterin synthase